MKPKHPPTQIMKERNPFLFLSHVLMRHQWLRHTFLDRSYAYGNTV